MWFHYKFPSDNKEGPLQFTERYFGGFIITHRAILKVVEVQDNPYNDIQSESNRTQREMFKGVTVQPASDIKGGSIATHRALLLMIQYNLYSSILKEGPT